MNKCSIRCFGTDGSPPGRASDHSSYFKGSQVNSRPDLENSGEEDQLDKNSL